MAVPEKYISYLLSDIDDAFRKEPRIQIIDNDDDDIEGYLEDLDDWLDKDEEDLFPFSYHCGLTREMFPPADQLSEYHKEILIEAMHYLLLNYNLSVLLPEYLDLDLEYHLLVSVLDQKVVIVDHGFIGIEFCDYESDNCIFGDQCMCNGFTEEDYDEESYVSDEINFDDIFEALLIDSFDTLYYDDDKRKWESEMDDDMDDLPF